MSAGAISVLLGAALLAVTVRAAYLEQISLSAPFLSHDHRGTRIIPFFDRGGDALVMQSFLRVNPDKQSQRGYAWSRNLLDHPEFSIEWKFRISGANERFYGDSLTLFITDKHAPPEDGHVFGFTDKFVGIGLSIDTFRNAGPEGRHRDVSLIVNNGTRGEADLHANLGGCNGNLRYWEGRDDFNVLKASRVRIRYGKQNGEDTILVELDARNTGRWRRCTTLTGMQMPEDWARRATVGLLGVTGEVTNNHDTLSLRVYSTQEEAWSIDMYDKDEDDFEMLVHHMEHEMFTVHDNLKAAINQLEEAEEAAEERIAVLEHKVTRDFMHKLEERVAALELKVQSSVAQQMNQKISHVENTIQERVESKVQETVGQVSSWRTPFYSLAGVVLLILGAVYWWFRTLRKEHLL